MLQSFENMKTSKHSQNPSLSVLHKPMNSTFFGRILYYSYFLWLRRFFLTKRPKTRNDLRYFWKSSLFLLGMVGLIVIVVGFRCVDVLEVYSARDYDRPSEVYGKDQRGNSVHFATFSTVARNVIQLPSQSSPAAKAKEDSEAGNKEDSEAGNHAEFENALPKIVTALLIAEDTNYYYHFGIDITGILRALITNMIYGEIREGASTISQQVARLRFLRHERSYIRKLREMFLAFLLEGFYSKHKILEDYLNMVPLGHGTYGVSAAAQFYFNKDYRDLNWGESAVIASLTTRPREFSPILNPKQSMRKTRITLQKLIRAGENRYCASRDRVPPFTRELLSQTESLPQ